MIISEFKSIRDDVRMTTTVVYEKKIIYFAMFNHVNNKEELSNSPVDDILINNSITAD